MRKGGAPALRWENLSLNGAYLQVVETGAKTHPQGIVVARTEAKRSVRTVDLDPGTVALLIEHPVRPEDADGDAVPDRVGRMLNGIAAPIGAQPTGRGRRRWELSSG